jgi:hypothetical protein
MGYRYPDTIKSLNRSSLPNVSPKNRNFHHFHIDHGYHYHTNPNQSSSTTLSTQQQLPHPQFQHTMCIPSKSYLNVHSIHSPLPFPSLLRRASYQENQPPPSNPQTPTTNPNAIPTTILRPKSALTHLAHLPTTQSPRLLHRSVLPLRFRTHHRTSRIRFTLNHICIHIIINIPSRLTLRRIRGSADYHIAAYIIVNNAHIAGYTTTIAAYQIHREAV